MSGLGLEAVKYGMVPVNGKLTLAAIPEIGVPLVSSDTVSVVDSPGLSVLAAGLMETSTVPPGIEAFFRGSTDLLERTRAMITPTLITSIPARVIMIALGERSVVVSVFGTILLYSAVNVLRKSSVILSAFFVVAMLLVVSNTVLTRICFEKTAGFNPTIESNPLKSLPSGLSVSKAKSAKQ